MGELGCRSMSHALAIILSSLVLVSGCAGDYVARTYPVRASYQGGDYDRAFKLIQSEEKGPQIDRLLVLLDKGMILHAAGKWEESIKTLAEADRLSQQLD